VRLHEPTATSAVLPHRAGHLLKRVVFRTDEVMVLEDPEQPVGDTGSRRTTHAPIGHGRLIHGRVFAPAGRERTFYAV
jgi:hypothetical protein